MAAKLKQELLFLIHHIYPADYMLIMLIAFLFIVLLIFLILTMDSKFMSFLILLFIIIGLPTLGVFGEKVIDSVARKRFVLINSAKIFEFSNSLHVDFTLQNQSKRTFKYCKVMAKIYKNNDANTSKLMQIKNDLQVLRRKSVEIKRAIKPNGLVNASIIFKDFAIKVPYHINTSSTCF